MSVQSQIHNSLLLYLQVLPSRRIRKTFDFIVINVHPYRSVYVYVQTMPWQLFVAQHSADTLY